MSGVQDRAAAPHRRRRVSRFQIAIAQYFDRSEVLRRLDALRTSAHDDGAAHLEIVAIFRDALAAARDRIRHDLENGGDGLRCALNLSLVQDELIRAVYEHVVRDIGRPGKADSHGIVVAAVGGYGRGALAPASTSTFFSCCRPGTTLGRCR